MHRNVKKCNWYLRPKIVTWKYSQTSYLLILHKKDSISLLVVSDSLWPHGLQPTRLLCPWNSLGRNTGMGSHSLLQGIFPTQGSNQGLLHCRQVFFLFILLPSEPPENPLSLCINLPSGVGWGGRWEGGPKGRGYMYTYGWFMLRFDRKQQNSAKKLSFNKKYIN